MPPASRWIRTNFLRNEGLPSAFFLIVIWTSSAWFAAEIKIRIKIKKIMSQPIVIAIDGTSASGKSTNAKLVAKALGFVYVDTGAMYRTLAWYCLRHKVEVENQREVAAACRKWKTSLECVDAHVHLKVDGYYPGQEIRTAEVSAAVPHVAAVPNVREWMKQKQRECIRFGNLV